MRAKTTIEIGGQDLVIETWSHPITGNQMTTISVIEKNMQIKVPLEQSERKTLLAALSVIPDNQ